MLNVYWANKGWSPILKSGDISPCNTPLLIPYLYPHRIFASHPTCGGSFASHGAGRRGRGSTGDGASAAAAALRAGAGLSLIGPAAAASHGTQTARPRLCGRAARPRLCGRAARLRADNAVKLLGLGKAASQQPAPSRSSRAGRGGFLFS